MQTMGYTLWLLLRQCKNSWHFFLYHLSCVVGVSNDEMPLTFISDRQKGITLALQKEFPGARHRVYCRHLLSNIKNLFPGISLALENYYCIVARASNKFVVEKAMTLLRKCSEDVFTCLSKLIIENGQGTP